MAEVPIRKAVSMIRGTEVICVVFGVCSEPGKHVRVEEVFQPWRYGKGRRSEGVRKASKQGHGVGAFKVFPTAIRKIVHAMERVQIWRPVELHEPSTCKEIVVVVVVGGGVAAYDIENEA